ncbi:MAG: RloB domain-containing protein [Thermaerobacter sp.]|nr:RloB domain-containing protein [Thermaerobacter sp.]
MSRRATNYRRGARPPRQQNNVILVVCAGETESTYFSKFKIDLGTVKVRTVVDDRSPINIVRRALNEKSQGKYIQVWCVFDKDEFHNFDDAIKLARQEDVRVASSNQAFELWFILHFRRQDGAFHRNNYARELNNLLGRTYVKTDPKLYKTLKPKTTTAIKNARLGYECHKRKSLAPSKCESYTTVFKLVEELLKWTNRS